MSFSFLIRTLALWLVAGAAMAQNPAPACNWPPPPSQDEVQAAARRPTDRGFLWRVEKGGRTSWLYGTMHVGKPDWFFPGERLRDALRQSDVLALELVMDDPVTQAVLGQPTEPAVLARLLTPERQRRLDRQVAEACLPAGALATQRPILQVITLAGLSERRNGLFFDWGSEVFLETLARGIGKPLVALETAQGQLQTVIGNNEAEENEEVDEALGQLESGLAARMAARLSLGWANSDWKDFSAYLTWCDCVKTPADKRSLRRLLEERNPGLADGIAALHGKGQRVFAAVGALHMVGPQGLPTLLAAQGFAVTRVVPAP